MSLPAAFRGYQDQSGRITRLPAKHSKKVQLCMAMLVLLDSEVEYTEKEINEIFLRYVDDFAFVRRTLADMGFLERDRYGRAYRRVSGPVQQAS